VIRNVLGSVDPMFLYPALDLGPVPAQLCVSVVCVLVLARGIVEPVFPAGRVSWGFADSF
jgi:hypothetical protein